LVETELQDLVRTFDMLERFGQASQHRLLWMANRNPA
jgi:hypothetical protein